MNDLPKEGLRALVAQEGMALLGDPERARALLEERFPQFPEEIEALVRVLEEGVMEFLAQGANLSAQAPELEARTGLSLEQILWGAQGWVDALPPAPPSGLGRPPRRARNLLPASRSSRPPPYRRRSPRRTRSARAGRPRPADRIAAHGRYAPGVPP